MKLKVFEKDGSVTVDQLTKACMAATGVSKMSKDVSVFLEIMNNRPYIVKITA